MTSIPEILRPFIETYLEVLLLWFSDHMYAKLLPFFAEHPLLCYFYDQSLRGQEPQQFAQVTAALDMADLLGYEGSDWNSC